MRKRILCLIYAISIIISLAVVPAHADGTLSLFEDKLKLLMNIGIMHTDEDMTEDTIVSRERFAKELLSFHNLNGHAYGINSYYYDVGRDNTYLSFINAVTERGLMQGSDGYFRPSDSVTNLEILKCVVCALGYGEVAAQDGWPTGYSKIAMDLDLTDGMKNGINSEATVGDMVTIFYNALYVPVMEAKLTSGTPAYEVNNDVTFMEKVYDIYKAEGVINRTSLTSLQGGASGWDDNYVQVGATTYYVSDERVGISDYIGYYVELYYRDIDDKEIIAFYPKKNKELIIPSDKFESYNNGTIKYIESDRIKRVNLSKNPVVIYNGVTVTSYDDSIFNIKKGSIELISNNNSSDYNIVKIYDYKNYVVSSASEKVNSIFTGGKGEIFKLDSYERVFIRDKNKNRKALSDLKEWNVISVGESKDKSVLYITVSEEQHQGRINSYGVDDYGNRVITLGDTEYTTDSDFYKNTGFDLKGGVSITLYLDYRGEAAYARASTQDEDWKYGYLMNILGEEGMDDYKVRVFTSSGGAEEFGLANKVTIDSMRKTNDDVVRYLSTAEDSKIEPQLIKYVVDKEIITKIDTQQVSDSETKETSLSEDLSKKEMRFSRDTNRFFIYDYDNLWDYTSYFTALRMSSASLTFVVPDKLEDKRKNTRLFATYSGNSYFNSRWDKVQVVSAYDIDAENGDLAKAFVVETGTETLSYHGSWYVIEDIKTTLNSYGDIVKELSLYKSRQSGLVSYTVAEHVSYFNMSYNSSEDNGIYGNKSIKVPLEKLEKGDVINIATNPLGEIIGISRYFGKQHLGTSIEYYDSEGDLVTMNIPGTFIRKHGVAVSSGNDSGSAGGAASTCMLGVLTDRKGKFVKFFNCNPFTVDKIKETGNIAFDASSNIYHYDQQSRKLEPITTQDIDAYLYKNNKNAYVFSCSSMTLPYLMVIYD